MDLHEEQGAKFKRHPKTSFSSGINVPYNKKIFQSPVSSS